MNKTMTALALAATLVPAVAYADGQGGKSLDQLPPKIKQAVESVAPVPPETVFTSARLGTGKSLITFERSGTQYKLIVSKDGKIDRVMESVSYKPAPASHKNSAIGDVASLHEDVTEFAISGDKAKVQEGLNSISTGLAAIRPLLGEPTFGKAEANVKLMGKALAAGEMGHLALAAADNYKVLVQALDRTVLIVPVDVSMLDYTGFKLSTIASAPQIDWALAGKTVEESSKFWMNLEQEIDDKGLRDLMNSVHDGLKKAVSENDASQLAFGGKMELDAVDLLESYFSARYKTGTGSVSPSDFNLKTN